MNIKERMAQIAAWFQPAYNKIEKWDCPMIRELCKVIWPLLDDKIKKALYDFIMLLIEKYGEEKAADIVRPMLSRLK